jgi:hypothetical protein
LRLDHHKIIDDDTMIKQILYNTNSRHYDTMVTFLKLEIKMNGSAKLSLEDVKKAHMTVHSSITHNHKRDKRNGTDLFTNNVAETPGKGYTKVFKVDCITWLQKGHKSANCWDKPANKDDTQFEEQECTRGGTFNNII